MPDFSNLSWRFLGSITKTALASLGIYFASFGDGVLHEVNKLIIKMNPRKNEKELAYFSFEQIV